MKTALSDGHNIAMKTLADEIFKTVLAEPYLNKDVVVPKITAILKAYIRKTNYPTHVNKKLNNTKVAKYTANIHGRNIEIKYWKDEMRKLVTQKEMEIHFERLNNIIKECGL